MDLAVSEIEYMGRLVDELLFLGHIHEPQYSRGKARLDISALLSEEMEIASNRFRNINVNYNCPLGQYFIDGDSQLIKRMFRNALDNALSFAHSSVRARVSLSGEAGERIQVEIIDDGPGLTQEQIDKFGFKKGTRKLEASRGGRLSMGLGSLIMTAVAQMHGGSIRIENIVSANGAVTGARLVILF